MLAGYRRISEITEEQWKSRWHCSWAQQNACRQLCINPTDYDMANTVNDEPPQDQGPLYMHVVCTVGVDRSESFCELVSWHDIINSSVVPFAAFVVVVMVFTYDLCLHLNHPLNCPVNPWHGMWLVVCSSCSLCVCVVVLGRTKVIWGVFALVVQQLQVLWLEVNLKLET